MEIINEKNLSISEFEDISELSTEELEVIAGGGFWDEIKDAFNSLFNPRVDQCTSRSFGNRL
jgi:hypothetical protein